MSIFLHRFLVLVVDSFCFVGLFRESAKRIPAKWKSKKQFFGVLLNSNLVRAIFNGGGLMAAILYKKDLLKYTFSNYGTNAQKPQHITWLWMIDILQTASMMENVSKLTFTTTQTIEYIRSIQ